METSHAPASQPQSSSPNGRAASNLKRLEWLAASVIIAIAALQVARTYTIFSATFDEGYHLATGMEWLDRGSYTYEHAHPPLARIAIALGPYLKGVRSAGNGNPWIEGNAVLYQGDHYTTTLALARLGVLPFLIIGAFFFWRWARLLVGPASSLISLAVFTSLPPVLGHAGLATNDVPMLGTIAAMLYIGTRWIGQQSLGWSVALGVSAAAALVTKFSSVPYIGLTVVLVMLARWRIAARDGTPALRVDRSAVRGALIALGTALLVVWATYRFQIGTIRGVPVPASALIDGFRELLGHNAYGQMSYLLGRSYYEGVWYFFPVVLLVKTPIPVLLLGTCGLALLAIRGWRTSDWRLLLPGALSVAVLAVAMAARINVGVRHVLPLYIGLAVGCGVSLRALWDLPRWRWSGRALVAALVSSMLFSAVSTGPDNLAYFNVIAGKEPERWLVDSDLDWGQDLLRLADTVRARQIPSISINDLSNSEVMRHVPNAVRWTWRDHPTGWVAIGVTNLRRGGAMLRAKRWTLYPDAYAWLSRQRPVARVGKSLLLYYVPTATSEGDAASDPIGERQPPHNGGLARDTGLQRSPPQP